MTSREREPLGGEVEKEQGQEQEADEGRGKAEDDEDLLAQAPRMDLRGPDACGPTPWVGLERSLAH
jgi:hypothetical protein